MKTRSVWAYIYDNYLYDYDYFLLSGDDTHFIVENLRNVLDEMNVDPATPLYLGHWIPHDDTYFIGGGPGYLLNRHVVKILVETVFPRCLAHTRTSAEDRMIGFCLQTVAGIVGNSSVDAYGAQRFHGMDPHFVGSFRGKDSNKRFFQDVYEFWGRHYGFKTGLELISSQSVSFHLLRKPFWIKRHHAILYKSCPRGTVLGDIFAGKNSTSSHYR